MGAVKLIAEIIFFLFALVNIISAQNVKETTNPAKALKMLLQGTGHKNSDENICKPLNYDEKVMYDYINGDKICYFALNHEYAKKKKLTPLSIREYKKSECLKRDIVNEVGDTVIIDAALCHFVKNGKKDFFYTANTNRKDHYAILEMMPARPGTGPGTKLAVIAILNLQKLINLQKMQQYLMLRPFTGDHVCSPLEYSGEIKPNYLNGDKICHLARKRFNPIEHFGKAKCSLEKIIISDGESTIQVHREYMTSCTCIIADDTMTTRFIANMKIKNYYAIFEISRYKNNTPLLKIHGIFYLECTMEDFCELKDIFARIAPPAIAV